MQARLTMDYWGLVTRSFHILWKYKFLWFFGFFATAGGGSSGNLAEWSENSAPAIREWMLPRLEVIALVVMVLTVLWFAFFVMGLLSRGALIGSIAHAEREHDIRFGHAWSIGIRNFLKMLALLVLGFIAFAIGGLIFAVPVVLPLFGEAYAVSIAIGLLLLLPFLAFCFALAFTVTYAEREAVLRNQGIFASLGTGWELTRKYFWQSMVVWLVSLVSGLVFALCIIAALVILAVPFILLGLLSPVFALAIGIPIGLVAILVISGALGTYDYSLWTLAYIRIRDHHDGLDAQPPSPPVEA